MKDYKFQVVEVGTKEWCVEFFSDKEQRYVRAFDQMGVRYFPNRDLALNHLIDVKSMFELLDNIAARDELRQTVLTTLVYT